MLFLQHDTRLHPWGLRQIISFAKLSRRLSGRVRKVLAIGRVGVAATLGKKMRFIKYCTAVALLLVVGACGPLTSERLTEARAMKPAGSAFQNALWKEYLTYADYELNLMSDLGTAERNIDKAMMAGKGQTPPATDPSKSTMLAPDKKGELQSAYLRLNAALNGNGTVKAPEKAAEAQAAFDCWVEQQEENVQPEHIAKCKNKFVDAITIVEAAIKAPAPAPAPPPAPAPAPAAKAPGPFTVLFDLNKSNVRADQETVLKQASDAISKAKPNVVNVTGHTDTTGSYAHNLKLSEKRAATVAAALKKMGVTTLVATYWVGEDDLAVSTGDNTKEEKNRRAVIVLGK
ncbi:MAG: OmpA family protein [Alphaproteobacteria bacterium]